MTTVETTGDLLDPRWCRECTRQGSDVVHRGEARTFTPSEGDGLVLVQPVRCDELDENGRQIVYPGEFTLTIAGGTPVLSAGDLIRLADWLRAQAVETV